MMRSDCVKNPARVDKSQAVISPRLGRVFSLVTFIVVLGMTAGSSPGCSANISRDSDTGAVADGLDRTEGWLRDIDFLIEQIHRQHYVFKSKPLPPAFESRVKRVRANVADYSDERMLAELLGLTKELGDGHCYVFPVGAKVVEAHCLPFHFYSFSDGLFVVNAANDHQHWIGRKIVRFGPKSADVAMKEVADFVSRDNDMGIQWIGPFLLRFRGIWEAIGATKGAPLIAITFQDPQGKQSTEEVEFLPISKLSSLATPGIPKLAPPPPSICKLPPPLYLTDVKTPYWFKDLPAENAVYFQYNQVIDLHEASRLNSRSPQPVKAQVDQGRVPQHETIAQFAAHLQKHLEDHPPSLLIVDVRHNNGGHAELNAPLVALLKRFEANRPGAKIAILTSRGTFSACQMFISDVNRETRAIFAGEPSSSKPNFVGEENDIRLPYSGATASISNRYHESIPGDKRQWIEPTIDVRLASSDYFSNRDPVLEEVLMRFGKRSQSR